MNPNFINTLFFNAFDKIQKRKLLLVYCTLFLFILQEKYSNFQKKVTKGLQISPNEAKKPKNHTYLHFKYDIL